MPVLKEKQVWSSCTDLFKQLVLYCLRVLLVACEGLWTSLSLLSCIDLMHHKSSQWLRSGDLC